MKEEPVHSTTIYKCLVRILACWYFVCYHWEKVTQFHICDIKRANKLLKIKNLDTSGLFQTSGHSTSQCFPCSLHPRLQVPQMLQLQTERGMKPWWGNPIWAASVLRAQLQCKSCPHYNLRPQSGIVWLSLYLNWNKQVTWIRENGDDEGKKCRSKLHSFSYPTRPSVKRRSAPVIWSVNERLRPATQKAVFLDIDNTKKEKIFSLPFHPSAFACMNTSGTPELIFQVQDILA